MIHRIAPSCLVLLALLASPFVARHLWAEQPMDLARPHGPPLRFRRVFAPLDRIDQWPRDGVRYLPIDRKEFERLIQMIEANAGGPAELAARIERSRYYARLDGDHLVHGAASLDMEHTTGQDALLALGDCGLAIQSPRWHTTPATPAQVGWSDEGRLTVLVERPGTLRFEWALRGRREISGALNFEFTVPPSPITTLIIDLPAGAQPIPDGGLVVHPEVRTSDRIEQVADTLPVPDLRDGDRRWRIKLGGRTRFTLRVTHGGPQRASRQPVQVRQHATYEISPSGVDVSVELALDIYHEPLRKIALDLDAPLRLTSALLGDTAVAWKLELEDEQAPSRAILEFFEPIAGVGRILRLTGLAPLQMDGPMRLPTIRPRDVFWREGSATILIDESLSLDGLTTDGCRQTKPVHRSVPGSSETIPFELYRPDAAVHVFVSQRPSRLEIAMGTSIRLGPAMTNGQVVCNVRSLAGERFQLAADVSNDWIIDAVDAEPLNAIEDWLVEHDTAGSQRLKVLLRRPLRPQEELRVVISGRGPRAAKGSAMVAQRFEFCRFRNVETKQHLMSISAEAPRQVKIRGDSRLDQLDPRTLDAKSAGLVEAKPGDLLFAVDASTTGPTVLLSEKLSSYSAQVATEAIVDQDTLTESYRITCLPAATYVRKLLVHFSTMRTTSPDWFLPGDPSSAVTATRLSKSQQISAGLGEGGESWQIALRRPRKVSFELRAVRTSDWVRKEPVSLVSLPEASDVQAKLTIRARPGTALEIRNRRLEGMPADAVPPDQFSDTRAVYRYEPSRDVMASSSVAVVLVPMSGRDDNRLAWAWKCRITSHYGSAGPASHTAEFLLQNAGAGQLRISMPDKTTLHDVLVDGQQVPLDHTQPDQDVVVPLASAARYPKLVIHYSNRRSPLRTFDRVDFAVPLVDVPVLHYEWTAWLPRGYHPLDEALQRQHSGSAVTWRQRLFGVLNRPTGKRPFQGTSMSDWKSLVMKSADRSDADSDAADTSLSNPSVEPSSWAEDAPSVSFTGWQAHRVHVQPGRSSHLRVYRGPVVRAVGSAAFLIAFAVVYWISRAKPARLAWIATIVGSVALLAPTWVVPITSGAFLGVLLAMVCCLLSSFARYPSRQEAQDSSPKTLVISGNPAVMGLVVIVMAAGARIGAQEADPEQQVGAPPVHRIFIPVDQQQRPSGDKYYVPEQLYNSLYQLAGRGRSAPRGWLLLSAQYRCMLDWEESGDRLQATEWSAKFQITTFGRQTRVVLSIPPDLVRFPGQSALLDGRPIQLEASRDTESIEWTIDQPGTYQLELTLHPSMHTEGMHTGFTFSIPRVSQSEIELLIPSDAPQIQVPTARGDRHVDLESGRIRVQLGPADHLAVTWSEGSGRGDNAAALEVDERLWLTIRRGSVVLEAQHKFSVVDGTIRHMQLIADPRLRLLPRDEQSPIRLVDDRTEQPDKITFSIAEPTRGPVTIVNRFLVTGTSGIGNVLLPRLEAVGHANQRWLALSVDPELVFEHAGQDQLEPFAVSEFARAWGADGAPPQLAFRRLTDEHVLWTVSTRPREPTTEVQQDLAVHFGKDFAEFRFQADITTQTGVRLSHLISVPGDLQVTDVSLEAADAVQVARWARDDQGRVIIFFTGPVSGDYQLSLRGQMPAVGGDPLDVPDIRLVDAQRNSSVVHLYRQPGVLVEIESKQGVEQRPVDSVDEVQPGRGRLVAVFVANQDEMALTVRPSWNAPRVHGTEMILLQRDQDRWSVEVDYRIQVQEGVVDVLRFDVPSEFAEAMETEPVMQVVITALPGQARSRVAIQLPEAVHEDFRILLRAPISTSPGQRVRVPRILPLDAFRLDQFVVVPTQVDAQPVVWQTQWLRRSAIPDRWEFDLPETWQGMSYRVVGDEFEAVLTPRHPVTGVPQVRLADVYLAWHEDHACYGLATFDVEPAGLTHVTLVLPHNYELIRATVAELPTHAIEMESHRWRLDLGPGQLPQRVEVIFSGRLPKPETFPGIRLLCAPTLLNLAVGRTLWTIRGSGNRRSIPSEGAGQHISGSRQEMFRLKTLAAIVDLAPHVVSERSPQEIADWYEPWARRYTASRNRLAPELGIPSPANETTRSEVETIDREYAAVAEHLGTTAVREQATAQASRSQGSGDLWHATAQDASQSTMLMFQGARGTVPVGHASVWPGDFGARILAVLLVCAVGWMISRDRSGLWYFVTDWVFRWPYMLGTAVGLIWWLWLEPSVLGWVIVLASVLAALRQLEWTQNRIVGILRGP